MALVVERACNAILRAVAWHCRLQCFHLLLVQGQPTGSSQQSRSTGRFNYNIQQPPPAALRALAAGGR